MSWLYWAPKSRTTTRSWVGTRPSTAGAPRGRSSGRPGPAVRTAILPPLPHALRELDRLALGHESRRDDDLGLLHLPDRARAAHPHGRPQGLHQVLRPVVDPRRPEDDVAQGPGGAHRDPRAPGEGGVGCGHPPVVPP